MILLCACLPACLSHLFVSVLCMSACDSLCIHLSVCAVFECLGALCMVLLSVCLSVSLLYLSAWELSAWFCCIP